MNAADVMTRFWTASARSVGGTAAWLGGRLPGVLVGAVVVLLAWWLSRAVRRAVRKVTARTSTTGHVDVLLSRFAQASVLAVGVVVALGVAGVNVAALLASLGIAGVTIGLALKDVLSNYVAGVILLVQRPFSIGDDVVVGTQEGTVLDVHSRATVLRAPDGRTVHIPNSTVFAATVLNATTAPVRRFDVNVDVIRGADLHRACEDVLAALRGVEGVLADPAPDVAVRPAGPHSWRLAAHAWVDTRTASLADARNAAHTAIDAGVREAGTAPRGHTS